MTNIKQLIYSYRDKTGKFFLYLYGRKKRMSTSETEKNETRCLL